MSLHNCMSGHGPDAASFEKAIAADVSQPDHLTEHHGLHVPDAQGDPADGAGAGRTGAAGRLLHLLAGHREAFRSGAGVKAAALIVLLEVAMLAGCSGNPARTRTGHHRLLQRRPRRRPWPMAAPAARSPERAPESGQSSDGLPRFDGYGDMRLGMDEAAFRRAWQGDLAGTVDAAGGCSVLRPVWVKQPRDVGFLFEQGHFARYDVGTAKEAAFGGGKVGMDVAGIRALYGNRVQVTPHKVRGRCAVPACRRARWQECAGVRNRRHGKVTLARRRAAANRLR